MTTLEGPGMVFVWRYLDSIRRQLTAVLGREGSGFGM